jgi:hypothetical protein
MAHKQDTKLLFKRAQTDKSVPPYPQDAEGDLLKEIQQNAAEIAGVASHALANRETYTQETYMSDMSIYIGAMQNALKTLKFVIAHPERDIEWQDKFGPNE